MCHHIADAWWGILNSFMARGWSAFLWILQKNCRLGEAETHRLDLCDTTPMHSEDQHPTSKHRTFKLTGITTFFHSGTSLVLGNALVHPFEKNPALVVAVKLIWFLFLNLLFFNFLQTLNKSLRFIKLRRSNVHRSVVVQTNHCQVALLFLLDVRYPKCSHSFFCGCLPPKNSAFA